MGNLHELALDALILRIVRDNPGMSQRAIAEEVDGIGRHGDSDDIGAVLSTLVHLRRVVRRDRTDGYRGFQYFDAKHDAAVVGDTL